MHVPFHSHRKTGPSSERRAKIDLGAIPEVVREVLAFNSEICNEARGVPTGSGL